MYACMLAVTNPDTVKRIRSTLRRTALCPVRDVAGAFAFAFARVLQALALRLVFVPPALRLQLSGNEKDVSQRFE